MVNGADVFTALGSTNAQGIRSDEDDGWHVADCLGGATFVNGEEMSLTYGESKANAYFFAACDPDTIRDLLAERDALQAECDALRSNTRLSLGVGDGYGNLFVHGDYDSIKRVQALIFENEWLRKDAERYYRLRTGDIDDIAVVRGLGAMDYGMSAVIGTYSEEIDGDVLDAAIDVAMKKEDKA